MNVLSLDESKKADLLASIDDIRKAADAGEIIAIAAVGMEPDDKTRYYFAAAGKVTLLRVRGAIQAMAEGFKDRFG